MMLMLLLLMMMMTPSSRVTGPHIPYADIAVRTLVMFTNKMREYRVDIYIYTVRLRPRLFLARSEAFFRRPRPFESVPQGLVDLYPRIHVARGPPMEVQWTLAVQAWAFRTPRKPSRGRAMCV